MTPLRILSILPLLFMLISAAVTDLRTRKIHNWLTFSIILTGLCRPMLVGAPPTIGQAVLGMFAGAALFVCALLLVRL